MILHRFEQIRTSTRQLFVFIKQANTRMGLAHHDYPIQRFCGVNLIIFLADVGVLYTSISQGRLELQVLLGDLTAEIDFLNLLLTRHVC